MHEILTTNPIWVVDVGCAGGIDNTWARIDAHGQIKMIGFEASPTEFEKLPSGRAEYHHLAISNKTGEATFHAHGTTGSLNERDDRARVYGEQYSEVRVPSTRLDTLRIQRTIPSLDVLKIDVEGHEMEVLEGAGSYLDSETFAIKIEMFFGVGASSFHDIHRFLVDRGFLLFGLSFGHDITGAIAGSDGLYLRSIEGLIATGSRQQVIKAVANAIWLRHLDYARLVIQRSVEEGILCDEDAQALNLHANRWVYLPPLLPRAFPGLTQAFFVLSQICAGWWSLAKSSPKSNRLVPSRFAFVRNVTPLVKRREQKRQVRMRRIYAKLYQALPADGFDRPEGTANKSMGIT